MLVQFLHVYVDEVAVLISCTVQVGTHLAAISGLMYITVTHLHNKMMQQQPTSDTTLWLHNLYYVVFSKIVPLKGSKRLTLTATLPKQLQFS